MVCRSQGEKGEWLGFVNINSFIEQEHRARSFYDHDGSKQRPDHSVLMSEQALIRMFPNHKNDQISSCPG